MIKAMGKQNPPSTPASSGLSKLPFFIIGTILTVAALVFGPVMCSTIQDDNLRKRGTPATAVLIELEDTGNRFNDNPEVEVTMDVTLPTGSQYRITMTRVLSVVDLAQFRVGDTLDVKYDKTDSTRVANIGRHR